MAAATTTHFMQSDSVGFMRVFLAIAALGLLVVPAVSAEIFGVGPAAFDTYVAPSTLPDSKNAGEPTIGVTWDNDHAFYQAFAHTYKIVFDDNKTDDAGAPTATWTDVTPSFTVTNVDPMLHADHVTNRVWAGGLAGACSLMGMSDDDGASWIPAGNMCNFAQFDHQSIGSGPWSDSPVPRATVYPRATYYCSQGQIIGFGNLNYVGTACTTSVNGGLSWLPFTEVLGGCAGLHGHIRVSEVTGTAAVPDGSCTDAGESGNPVVGQGASYVGFGYSSDNGATWNSRTMPSAAAGNGFDPSLDFSRQSGWLWLAQADDLGIHVAMSKDEGATWQTLGASGEQWFNLTDQYHDAQGNPLKFGAFADVVAGDDNRTAISFLATTDPKGDHPFDDAACSDSVGEHLVWFQYLAQTFNAGATWTVTRVSEDPVQIGTIWGGGGGQSCRNLLDFADMDVDSHGRLYIASADGCIDTCAKDWADHVEKGTAAPKASQSRASYATIFRQTAGKGLFAKDDTTAPHFTATFTGSTTTKGSPSVALPVLATALVAVVLARRRKA